MKLFKRKKRWPFPIQPPTNPAAGIWARVSESPWDAVHNRSYSCFNCEIPVFFWKGAWCVSDYTYYYPSREPLRHGVCNKLLGNP